MTSEDYIGRSNALELEMRRIRGILDQHAYAKHLGVAADDSPQIRRAYEDQADVLHRFQELDREFWGDALSSKARR